MNSPYVNRELSWLEFNRRVLEEAQDPTVPLLERVKFLAIFSSNLDEFFMVRVAGLKRRALAGDSAPDPDGLTPAQTLAAISERVHELVDAQHRCFLDRYFRPTLLPVLTPLAIDPAHPFPHLANRSLCLVASLQPTASSLLPHATLTVVHIPGQVVNRFVALPSPPDTHAFMLLEDVIRLHLPLLYHGYEVVSCHAIRVTRDAEFEVKRGRADDLLTSIEAGLRERRMGSAVRLQSEAGLPTDVREALVDELELEPGDLYEAEGFTAFSDLFQLYAAVDLPRLKERPRPPLPVPAFESAPDVWSPIRAGDILVHHPYQSLDAVTRFVQEAACDPRVLAIKMTLY